jgi:peroxiredoxin Q/BCP
VSPDRSDRQKQFDEANDLGFTLLADHDKQVAKQFGVARFGPLPVKRVTFVIGADRRVKAIIKSETNMNTHADEALAAVRELSAAG